MRFPISIQSSKYLVDADFELVCCTESATPEELATLVAAANRGAALLAAEENVKENTDAETK